MDVSLFDSPVCRFEDDEGRGVSLAKVFRKCGTWGPCPALAKMPWSVHSATGCLSSKRPRSNSHAYEMWGQVGATKETLTFGGIRDETVAMIYMLHLLIATPSSQSGSQERQFPKFARRLVWTFQTSFVRMLSHVILHRHHVRFSSSRHPVRRKVLQMCCTGTLKILSVSLVSALSGMATCATMAWDQILVRQLSKALLYVHMLPRKFRSQTTCKSNYATNAGDKKGRLCR